jgi:hypothetical protein
MYFQEFIYGQLTTLPRSFSRMSSLGESAQSEAETLALKFISRSWLGLAGQIDRYNELMRKPAPSSRSKVSSGSCAIAGATVRPE